MTNPVKYEFESRHPESGSNKPKYELTLRQILEVKQATEKHIQDTLTEFTSLTGVVARGIDFESKEVYGDSSIYPISAVYTIHIEAEL